MRALINMSKNVFDDRGDFEPVDEFNEKLAEYVENPEEMQYVGTTADEMKELEAMESPGQRRSLASFHRTHRHHHHHSHHSQSSGRHSRHTVSRTGSGSGTSHHSSNGEGSEQHYRYASGSEDLSGSLSDGQAAAVAINDTSKEAAGVQQAGANSAPAVEVQSQGAIPESPVRSAGAEFDHTQEPTANTGQTRGTIGATVAAASKANPRATHSAASIESKGSRRQRRKKQRRTTILGVLMRILIVLCILIVGSIVGLLVMRYRGEKSMRNAADVELQMDSDRVPDGVENIEDDGKTIYYKGEKYRWNDKISTILFLGSDRTVKQQEKQESVIGTNGQADTLILGIVDNQNKKISFININRDTMSYVSQYTPDGDYAGDTLMQICLAYSYGKDNEDSCKLVASAVSNFLYGMPVNSYCRLSYDVIPTLNDSIGGVTVKVLEDMTSKDPTLVKGAEVTLVGSQALDYVRWRNHAVTETNELRMARQKQYLYAFMKRTIEATRADLTLPLGLYNNARPYMTTDITPSRVTYLTSKVLEYGIPDGAIRSVQGESIDGANGLVEFHQDDTKLYEMILETFYNKVK